MNDDEQLKTMNLHDVVTLVTASHCRAEVMRVKNGWIYNFFGSTGQSSCFVPEPEERPWAGPG